MARKLRRQGIRTITVYCAASADIHPEYNKAANALGRLVAHLRLTVICGGGKTGLMKSLIDGVYARDGGIVGVLPRFLHCGGHAHRSLTEVLVTPDLHSRKRIMLDMGDAFVCLPGGSGTLEEAFEAVTWKRLKLHTKPIVFLNTRGFFTPCLEMIFRERFMSPDQKMLWEIVDSPEQVPAAILTSQSRRIPDNPIPFGRSTNRSVRQHLR